MTPEVLELALRTESPRVEWRSSDRGADEVPQAVCALADGVSGGQIQAVAKAREEFTSLTHELLRRMSAA